MIEDGKRGGGGGVGLGNASPTIKIFFLQFMENKIGINFTFHEKENTSRIVSKRDLVNDQYCL